MPSCSTHRSDPAVATSNDLYLRRLGDFSSTLIAGTRGGRRPAFSPDGRSIVFVRTPELEITRVSLDAGAPQVVCRLANVNVTGLSWHDGWHHHVRVSWHQRWRGPDEGERIRRRAHVRGRPRPRPRASWGLAGHNGSRTATVCSIQSPGKVASMPFGDYLAEDPRASRRFCLMRDLRDTCQPAIWYSFAVAEPGCAAVRCTRRCRDRRRGDGRDSGDGLRPGFRRCTFCRGRADWRDGLCALSLVRYQTLDGLDRPRRCDRRAGPPQPRIPSAESFVRWHSGGRPRSDRYKIATCGFTTSSVR